MNRMTWQTIDHAAMRWSAFLAVGSVVAAVVVAVRLVAGEVAEAIFGATMFVLITIGWWAMNQLRTARVTIDETGVRREGRGGFALTWAQIRMAGIGSGLVGGDSPYLLLATTRRRSHNSVIPAAGAGFSKPSAAVPLEAAMVPQVEQLMAARGLLRTAEQWSAQI